MLYSSKDKIEKNYDVIVVGSGLGGLTLANKLARDGKSILLLESHNKLGGLATWFRRKKEDGTVHVFDVSLHGFPYGMIKTCRRYWNKEIADRIEQIHSVKFINPQFEVETTFTKEDYIRVMVEHFHASKENVEAFFDELAKMNFYDDNRQTNRELFEKYFSGRSDIVRFLLEPIVYANGSTLDDPAISYGIVFSNFMNKGVYIFKGGTDLMISMMRDELLKNNVDIQLQQKVDKILVENNKVVGVQIKDHVIKAQVVASNANLKSTILDLVGGEYFSLPFLSGLNEVRLNTSSCQVYMGIKKGETLPFVGDLIFTSEDQDFSSERILSPSIHSQTFSIYYPEMRPESDPMYAVVSSSNARFSDWEHLSDDEYEDQKKYIIEKAIAGFEKIVPGIREKIDVVDAATPLTFKRYTHHLEGASFGTKFEGLPYSMELNKEIDGLFHVGSVGIIMSGWLGAANYGVIKAHEVMNYLGENRNSLQ